MSQRHATPRIVTVCLHPAIDRTISVARLGGAALIRGRLVTVEASGKGNNVAHSLLNLGRRTLATGFLAADDREFFLASFHSPRAATDFVTVRGATRESVTLIEEETGRDIHVTAGALVVRPSDVRALSRRLKSRLRRTDWVVFSGSSPMGMKTADLARLMGLCATRGARLCVDTSGPRLRAALRRRPWLVKPNEEELRQVAGTGAGSLPAMLAAARALAKRCENVLLSLGANGAMLVNRSGAWHARERGGPPVVDTVGCGDALLAGFIHAASAGKDFPAALRYAVACGSACARSHYACIRSRAEPAAHVARIKVAVCAR